MATGCADKANSCCGPDQGCAPQTGEQGQLVLRQKKNAIPTTSAAALTRVAHLGRESTIATGAIVLPDIHAARTTTATRTVHPRDAGGRCWPMAA